MRWVDQPNIFSNAAWVIIVVSKPYLTALVKWLLPSYIILKSITIRGWMLEIQAPHYPQMPLH